MSTNRMSLRKTIRIYKTGTLFFLPYFILFALFIMAPVFIAVFLSFTDYNLLTAPDFVGFLNYKLLFLEDDIFILSLQNTLKFAVIAGPLSFLFSFLLAWAINQLRLRNLFALAFYVPSIINSIAIGVVWMYLFASDRYGLVNNFLYNLGLINEPVLWNQNPGTIMPVIILIYVWMNMGTNFLSFLAGLQNTSQEISEAGMIDGIRSRAQELWYITLPQLKPQLLFAAITVVTNAFSVFEIVVGFAGMPSANYAGHTIVAHLYDYAFTRFEMGYASAIACVLVFFTFTLGQLLTRALSSKD